MTVTMNIPETVYTALLRLSGVSNREQMEVILAADLAETIARLEQVKLNKNVTAQDFLKALQSAPDVEPEEFDRL
ncbi:MAG: hypothetical protein U0264_13385 [Candidatus Kapaibacterium sp.]